MRRLLIRDLVLHGCIGVHPHEHRVAQRIRLNLDLGVAESSQPLRDELAQVVDYEALVEQVRQLVGSRHVSLVETLAEHIAELCLDDPRVRLARVRVEKLDAIADAAAVGVEILRSNPRPLVDDASPPAR
jgi:dihydroneopterin aldolase